MPVRVSRFLKNFELSDCDSGVEKEVLAHVDLFAIMTFHPLSRLLYDFGNSFSLNTF